MAQPPPPEPAARYRAFISYSHGTDRALATALASALGRFARPWYRVRAMRVFLDQHSLSADPALWASIERSLATAQWLVFLANPTSAASPWVGRELSWWRANRSMDRMLIAHTGGTIAWSGDDFDWVRTTALPDSLRGGFAQEPLWADFTQAASWKRLSTGDDDFRAAFLRIAAPLHGLTPDQLWSEHLARWRRKWAAIGAAVLLFALIAWGVKRERDIASERDEHLASVQLGARALMLQPRDPALAARIALAGVARRPSGVAAMALRHALAVLAGDPAPSRVVEVPGAIDIAFSPDGGRVAVLGGDGALVLVDVSGASGAAGDGLVRTAAAPMPVEARAIAWAAPDSIAVAAADGVWLRVGAAPPRKLVMPAARRVAFDPAGRSLAVAHDDGHWRVLSLHDDRLLASGAVDGRIDALAFSTDGARLAVGAAEVSLWDVTTAKALARWRADGGAASLDFNRSGETTVAKWMLAIVPRGGPLRVIDPEPASAVTPASAPSVTLGAAAIAARFAASGRCLAVASAQGEVSVLTGFGFGRLFNLKGGTGAVRALALGGAAGFAVLREVATVELYEQPLCGDAEALCRFAEPRMRTPMSTDERWRHLPPAADGPVSQPPGPACSALIGRVLGSWR